MPSVIRKQYLPAWCADSGMERQALLEALYLKFCEPSMLVQQQKHFIFYCFLPRIILSFSHETNVTRWARHATVTQRTPTSLPLSERGLHLGDYIISTSVASLAASCSSFSSLVYSVVITNGSKAEVHCRAKDSVGKREPSGILSFLLICLQIVGCPFRSVIIL